jgi:DNA polymerase-3 subunit alpha
LDGVIKIPDLVGRAKEFGMNSLALTDHGVMYGIYDFYLACKDAGIKPILGVEAYVAPRTRFDKVPKIDNKRYHLVLLAKNLEGYRNLVKMVSISHLDGFYYRPRIDKELLEKYGKGLIGTSACLQGVVNNQLYQNQTQKAKEWVEFLQKNLDDFYIEVQRNGIKEAENLVDRQVQFAKEMDLPIVASCDSHYLNKDDWYAQEVLWAISDGKSMNDNTRRKSWSEEFYIKSPKEMAELFEDLPEAIENTQKIADKIEEFDIMFNRVQPQYKKIKDDRTAQEVLKERAFKGAEDRYGEVTEKIEERINYELEIIHDKGYDDYFLVVQDYIDWAIDNGILIGPGRGSGAGSVVAYALRITNIDPFRFELYFERFLNPERPSPPDFDIDFQDDRRDELFQYMTDTYGKECTAFIGTFGRMKTRAAIRDVARVLDINLEVADRLSKMVDVKFGKVAHMKDMLEDNEEFASIINSDPKLQKLAEIVQTVEGVARHVSTHACGYLVTPDPIANYVPLQRESGQGDNIITQIEGGTIEYIGLMKFDFLGLSNLTIIKNALELIKQNKGEDIDIDDIPLDDDETLALFRDGDTAGIFQFESDGMQKYLKELEPTEFEDLIFLNAAYRPGPMQYIPDYIERKFGKQKVEYLHPTLEPILKSTFGFAIYQEQVLRIAVDVAGYTLGEADMLRRAMGKKKVKIMKQEKKKFIKGAEKNGISKKIAEEIFAFVEPFADYGFNKSHAACYTLIAFQTAYLKAHYPVEFMAGMLKTHIDDFDKISKTIGECYRKGIEILPPSVNESSEDFSIEGKNIRFGLAGIKNLGHGVVRSIIKERKDNGKYKHFDDFLYRISLGNINQRSLTHLIQAGALDEFGDRNSLLAALPTLHERYKNVQAADAEGQLDIFATTMSNGDQERKITRSTLPDVEPAINSQKVEWEKELLGMYTSAHPIANIRPYLDTIKALKISEIQKLSSGRKVKVCGLISNIKRISTKKNNRNMAFVEIEDQSNSIEVILFPDTYQTEAVKLQENTPTLFVGKINEREGQKSVICDTLNAVDMDKAKQISKGLYLRIPEEATKQSITKLKKALIANPGDTPVTISIPQNGQIKTMQLKNGINLTDEVEEVIAPFKIS